MKRGIQKKYVNFWSTPSAAHISRKTEITIVDVGNCRFFWPSIAVEGKFQCERKGLPDTPDPDRHVQLLHNLDEIRRK